MDYQLLAKVKKTISVPHYYHLGQFLQAFKNSTNKTGEV